MAPDERGAGAGDARRSAIRCGAGSSSTSAPSSARRSSSALTSSSGRPVSSAISATLVAPSMRDTTKASAGLIDRLRRSVPGKSRGRRREVAVVKSLPRNPRTLAQGGRRCLLYHLCLNLHGFLVGGQRALACLIGLRATSFVAQRLFQALLDQP